MALKALAVAVAVAGLAAGAAQAAGPVATQGFGDSGMFLPSWEATSIRGDVVHDRQF